MQKNRKLISWILTTAIASTTIFTNLPAINTKAESNLWNFEYTGSEASLTLPYNGEYQITVNGASGSSTAITTGGLGGSMTGHFALFKDTKLYINVGGSGDNGGYNGGGKASGGGNGGGASSVATTSGLLSNIACDTDNDDFDDGYNGLIAVGGGGGGATSQRAAINKDNSGDSTPYTFGAQTNSGAGGGDKGGDLATQLYYPSDAAQKWASSYYGTFEYTNLIAKNGYMTPNLEAGTQTSGYKKGIGESTSVSNAGAGGGGYYGGHAGTAYWHGGTGGSGYLRSDAYNTTKQSGTNSGNGSVTIKYLGKIDTTISVDLKDDATYNGESNFSLTKTFGDILDLSNVTTKDGYTLKGYINTITGDKYDPTNIPLNAKNISIKAYYLAPLTMVVNDDGNQKASITLDESDDYEKYYKIHQYRSDLGWRLANLDTAVNSTKKSTVFSLSGGNISSYTVPKDGFYQIKLNSARAGYGIDNGSYCGGNGGIYSGYIVLTKGDVLTVYCGSTGGNAQGNCDGEYHSNEEIVGYDGYGAFDYWGWRRTGAVDTADGNQVDGGEGGDSKIISSKKGTLLRISGGKRREMGGHQGRNNVAPTDGSLITSNSEFYYPNYSTGSSNGECTIIYCGDINIDSTKVNDIYTNDVAAPNAVSDVAISSASDKDHLSVSWKDNGDNGTDYKYYAESFVKDTNEYLAKSDEYDYTAVSKVKGYYYYIDTQSTGNVSVKNSTYTDTNKISITKNTTVSYIHVAAVDNAGNLSTTYSQLIPISYSCKYIVRNGDENGGGPSPSSFEITPGTAIGSDVPSVVLTDGWKFDGYYIGNTKYTADELSQYIPTGNTDIEIKLYPDTLAAGPVVEGSTKGDNIDDRLQSKITYSINKDDVDGGKLTTTAQFIITNKTSISDNIPTVGLTNGWVIKDYVIGTNAYFTDKQFNYDDTKDLSKYIIITDTDITIDLYPDMLGNSSTDAGLNTNETNVPDHIDDRNEFTVVFKGQSDHIVNMQVVAKGKSAVAPKDPVYKHHVFKKWDTDFSKVEDNLIVKAVFELEPVGITYSFRDSDVAGGTFTSSVTYDAKYGDLIGKKIPSFTLTDGWKFDSFNIDDTKFTDAKDLSSMQIESDRCHVTINLYPDVKGNGDNNATNVPDGIDDRDESLVTFTDYDGTVLNTQIVKNGETAKAPADPTYDHHVFTGWDKSYTNISGDLTVQATYDLEQLSVQYAIRTNDTEGGSIATTSYTIGYGLTVNNSIPDITLSDGWVLKKYVIDGTDYNKTDIANAIITKNTYVEIDLMPDILKPGIGDDTKGPDNIDDRDQIIIRSFDWDNKILQYQVLGDVKDAVVPKDPTRDGYKFTGWNKPYTNVTQSMDIFAQYDKLPVTKTTTSTTTSTSTSTSTQTDTSTSSSSSSSTQSSDTTSTDTAQVTTIIVEPVITSTGNVKQAARKKIVTSTEPMTTRIGREWIATTDDCEDTSGNIQNEPAEHHVRLATVIETSLLALLILIVISIGYVYYDSKKKK